jgi:ABC-type lipoprotein export system ATPase subunit
MSDVMIETIDLHRSYKIGGKSIEVLHGIELKILRGEKVFLCGPRGAGKTTLLYTLAGLEHPEKGVVHIDGADLYAMGSKQQSQFRNLKIGYVFQNYHLLPELTALENVSVPGAISGKDTTEMALKALDRVGLRDRSDHLPSELSGGEQQRVAIARAIASRPDILIFDEPTASLDGDTGRRIVDFVKKNILNHKRCIIIVTHDSRIFEYADRIMKMEDGRLIGIELGGEREK